MVDEDVVALAPGQAAGDIAQSVRGRSNEGNFTWVGAKKLGGELTALLEAMIAKGVLLIVHGAQQRIAGDRVHDAAGQGANGGVAEKDLFSDHGKFMAAQVFVSMQLGNRQGCG